MAFVVSTKSHYVTFLFFGGGLLDSSVLHYVLGLLVHNDGVVCEVH